MTGLLAIVAPTSTTFQLFYLLVCAYGDII